MTPLSARVEGNHWTIPLPYDKPPLSLNQRQHWAAKARETARVRMDVGMILKVARIGTQEHLRVSLHYRPRDKRRRDEDNLVATLKVCCDAIVDARIVPDDTPEFMTKVMPVIHPPGSPAVWLEVEVTP